MIKYLNRQNSPSFQFMDFTLICGSLTVIEKNACERFRGEKTLVKLLTTHLKTSGPGQGDTTRHRFSIKSCWINAVG